MAATSLQSCKFAPWLLFAAIYFFECYSPAFSSNDRDVLKQFDELIQKDDGSVDTKFLARVSRLAGTAIIFGGATDPGGAEKFELFAERCYKQAAISKQMRNYMACFVAISTVADQLSTLTKNGNLKI